MIANPDEKTNPPRGRPIPSPPPHVPTSPLEAAQECERWIQHLANSLMGEVLYRTQITDARDSMKRAETRATLNPEVDGKNEAQRRAQIEALMAADPDYRTAYENARTAESELVATQAQVTVALERIKLHRALLGVFAKGEGV